MHKHNPVRCGIKFGILYGLLQPLEFFGAVAVKIGSAGVFDRIVRLVLRPVEHQECYRALAEGVVVGPGRSSDDVRKEVEFASPGLVVTVHIEHRKFGNILFYNIIGVLYHRVDLM